MYFKSLELFGFKSFADRTRLDFEPGVTAIVGPNGGGKSNIADSIKWVLGEQSAKMLRGSRMDDVIFNGTDAKEPVNYAEVSLTLSNQDRSLPIEYDEVTVTRRLYRSGESEYLLNKTPVRLKDINELFMGTGIGTSAYSLIEQGRIDQILSSKPEDRREVFEEASGITKYKAKRKEALSRLEATEQNLLRINDIIQEVKRQINSIERQANKAERYKEKYEELKALELKLSRIEFELLRQKVLSAAEKLEALREKESSHKAELEKIGGALLELNRSKAEVENKRMELKSRVMEIDSSLTKSNDRVSLNKERIEELKKKCEELETEIQKQKDNFESQKKEAVSLREKVELLESEDNGREKSLQEKEHRLQEISKSIAEHETNISTSKANVIDIASRESKLKNQQAKLSATIATHDARIKRLNTEKETVFEEKNTLDAKLTEIVKEIGGVNSEVSSLKDEKARLGDALLESTKHIGEINLESEEINKQLAKNKSRLEILHEARLKYEGFSSGVKALLGVPGTNRIIEGVRDVLANLVSVEKGYEIAIETAIGENLEAIVVDNLDAAKKAILFLKERSFGRAMFIHPGSFEKSPESNLDIKDTRILGNAADFVKSEDFLRAALTMLLRNIFIVKTTEDGLGIMRDDASLKETRFITLSGEIVGRGFISGGNLADEGSTLINRDARIQELSIALAEVEQNARRLQDEKAACEAEKKELELKIKDFSEKLSGKEMLLANARQRKENVEENIKDIMDELSLVGLEIDEVKQDMTRLKNEEVTIAKAIEDIEKEALLNGDRIKKSEQAIIDHTKEREQLLIELAEQRTELASLESKKEGLSNTLSILESSLRDAELTLVSRNEELKNSIIKIEQLKKDISELEITIKALSDECVNASSDLDKVEISYKDIMAKLTEGETIFKENEKDLNSVKAELHDEDLKKIETNYSIDNLKQRISDVYKLNLEQVELAETWQDVDRGELKSEVEDKRLKLDSMGPVNLVAIEEHTELQDRHTFLINQRDDLLKAKESLLKAIAKINKTTKDLFIETFKNIQVEFRNFFKMLFGGGDGELMLLDEMNILESGIEIVARPPGKRLQNVSLLSGGEKALTAIALIFAIFKVKPSPFCILDEIDAPLDESNVDRFSRSLEIFTKTSQFIIITHNKKTIDMADVMYGITMQQSGISKVVSVKFSDSKEEEAIERV